MLPVNGQSPRFHRAFHCFLIYFALWAYVLFAVVSGVREIDLVRQNGVQNAFIICFPGGLLIAIGCFTIKVRSDLASFRSGAPAELLGVCLGTAADILLIYLWLDFTGADDDRKRLFYDLIVACRGIS